LVIGDWRAPEPTEPPAGPTAAAPQAIDPEAVQATDTTGTILLIAGIVVVAAIGVIAAARRK